MREETNIAYIRVDVSHTVINGTNVAFKAPCDCNAVAGLKVHFPNEAGIVTNQVFLFTDAHGNNLTGIGHLFAAGAIVKVILNIDEGKAYIQNADTNAYLEGKFEEKADLVDGKVPAEQLPAMDYIPTKEKGAVSGVATLGADGKVPTGQLPSMGYSKAETLNDDTKALFGLDAGGVPDDVFQKIKETFNNLRDFSKFTVEKISKSVNWTAPKATGQMFKVFAVGGGGGGGGSNGAGGGGGGGGYVEIAELTIAEGTVIPIVCGAGGALSGDGGTTSFGSLLSAAGGKKGGDGVSGGNGGAGGAGGAGGGGGMPYNTTDVGPGGAGGKYGGGGGAGGQNNRTYGAGGAGGLHGGGGGGSAGGAGGTYGGKGGSNAAGVAGTTLGATQLETLGNTMTGDGGAGVKNNGAGGGGGHGGNGGAGGGYGGGGGGGGYGGNGGAGGTAGGGGGNYGGNGGAGSSSSGRNHSGGGGGGLFCDGGDGGMGYAGGGGGILPGQPGGPGGAGGVYIAYFKEG